jgi:hypothetical protein
VRRKKRPPEKQAAARVPSSIAPSPVKVMVASTIYGFQDQLEQIVGVLRGYGYFVMSSHLGSVRVDPNKSNLDNCKLAVAGCDAFFGIVRPNYGSGVIGDRSITHEECLQAVTMNKPRWFVVDRNVVVARQLLKPYMFDHEGRRTDFRLRANPILSDLRVIDMYDEVVQRDVAPVNRVGNWVQEYDGAPKILTYLQHQFEDIDAVRRICAEMKQS